VSVDHYENFPVASWLCPPRLRAPIKAIYWFARTADDLADEGQDDAAQRVEQLNRYRRALHACARGTPDSAWPDVFLPLAMEMKLHRIPVRPLDDLLDAFCQDVANPVYTCREEVLDYCARSANPVGRLLLHLYGVDDAANLRRSDDICTALQLINFWQDLSVDLPRGRLYVPEEDLDATGLTIQDLHRNAGGERVDVLIASLSAWARRLMVRGAPLVHALPGRAGWELRLVVQGGLRILDKVDALGRGVLRERPVVGKADAPRLLWRAVTMRASSAAAREAWST